jgi:hypothetical protein
VGEALTIGRMRLICARPLYLDPPPQPSYASHVLVFASNATFDRCVGFGLTTKGISELRPSASTHVAE